jgi:hypothetical protein
MRTTRRAGATNTDTALTDVAFEGGNMVRKTVPLQIDLLKTYP